ncbi:DEAD/DEAH box helicase [Candidatus Woesearchaeota archaeon]|nr:DEAD/DEAH box helicase [Candidatus Woesearchaeota archaeon]
MNNLFEKLGLSQQLLETITKLKFTKPTQIQELSIPSIMEGKDVIGESATGSGKTLAFGCGIVNQVNPGKGVQALVLTPTRELAEQVKGSLVELAQRKLKVLSIYGGVSINRQIYDLRKTEVVVATPGRLLDHLSRGTINLSNVKVLVLDEADRMFDMGFIEDVEQIIQNCPAKRQTLFFSATISAHIKDLSDAYMTNSVEVSAKTQVDPSKLKQIYYDVPRNLKLSLLIHLLQHETSGLAMIFCNTRRTTDFVYKNLKVNKIDAIAIHGGLSQNKRTRTINSFNDAKAGVLVCTDVAARGLHIDNVSHIYNYELPNDSTDYVHRIGRTARAGEEGKVVNFLSERDYDNFSRILNTYREFDVKNVEAPYLKRVETVRVEDRSRGRRRPFSRERQGNRRPNGNGNPYRGNIRRN